MFLMLKGGKLYACFIDFSKAFDTIWHNGLFHKLNSNGINGHFLSTLMNAYDNTKCAIKLGKRLTNFFPCKRGLRQGDPLSPLLFNLYINDIFKELREANCHPVTLNGTDLINALAYADDLVLLSTKKEGLQEALNKVHEYCEKWKLKINYSKTKCVVFTKGNQNCKDKFYVDGHMLENALQIKYLGIIMNRKNCSFAPTLQHLRIKANRAVHALNSKLKISQLPPKIAMKLFDSMIAPILTYASEVWEPFINQDTIKWDYNDIEKTHLQFLKRILGVNRSTTNLLVKGETGRHNLLARILKRNINYSKYLEMKNDDSIVKQAYTSELKRPPDKLSFFSSIHK